MHDNTDTMIQDAQQNRTQLTSIPTEIRMTLPKGKVGYGAEDRDVAETRRKLENMYVDEDEEEVPHAII
jgi:hypothetical protein